MTWTVHCADVLTWCEDYAAKIERGEEIPFHGILTDPSYGLGDNPDIEALLTAWMSGEDYDTGPGFMQRDWDQLPSPRYWAALRRVCHPGAYLFAFGGTRTADLLSVALRLAGWERFDEIDVLGGSLSWVQGAGFPKSLNLGKKTDSAAGMEREVVRPCTYELRNNGGYSGGLNTTKPRSQSCEITAPATPLAAAWSQHGTATKPAHEPVLAFRNPLAKVPSDRIHAVTGWDWWHSEKLLKDTPHTRLKMLKKHGCRLPPLYGEADLVLITRKALHEGVETDKLFVARAKRQWREAPTEPVTLARVDVKAYRRWSSKTYAANCLSTGAGGLWIEGSRVATGETLARPYNDANNGVYGKYERFGNPNEPQGRWPPNVVLSHIPPRSCPHCDGSEFVPAEPITESWEEWYAKTKDYGGSREEWERLRKSGGVTRCPHCNGGWLPGCERLGVKRVQSSAPPGPNAGNIFDTNPSAGRGHEFNQGYADPDGTEPVTAYACVLACDACGHQWTAEQRGACLECGGEARWACAVGELGEQSGMRGGGFGIVGPKGSRSGGIMGKSTDARNGQLCGFGDQGTAARFYPQFTWQHEIAERLAGVTPFRYVSKAGRAQRDAGLEGMPLCEVGRGTSRTCANCDKPIIGLRQTEVCNCGDRKEKHTAYRNPHPTVKNIELTKWLATLLLPPPEYAPRRVLIPFGGSGSEAIGAGLAGWDEIVAIEMEEEYCQIAEARLAHWLHCIQMELSL